MFSGAIADNIKMLKPEATEQEICQVLKTACAWEFVEGLEEGINTPVRETWPSFFTGTKINAYRLLEHY